jgi:hypothetical protein
MPRWDDRRSDAEDRDDGIVRSHVEPWATKAMSWIRAAFDLVSDMGGESLEEIGREDGEYFRKATLEQMQAARR